MVSKTPMDIDPSLSALDNLIALVNRDYNYGVDVSDIQFSDPYAYYDPSYRNVRNTQVDAILYPGTAKQIKKNFKYWRVDLEYFDNQFVDISWRYLQTTDQILDVVATELGLIRNEIFVVSSEFPTFDPDNPEIIMRILAKPKSYAYEGFMNLIIRNDTVIDLSKVFVDGVLDGFEPTGVVRDANGRPILTETGQYNWL